MGNGTVPLERMNLMSFCSNQFICIQMYKCKNTNKTCIHLGNICDSYNDCPLGDDEDWCDLKAISCPLGCNCLLFAMECNNTAYKTIQTSYPYISMSIHQIYIPILNTVLEHFPKVIQLKLTRNNITDVCKSILPKSLVIVDLRFNALKSLCKDCFKCLKDLKIIFLDNNNISLIESLSFNNLINLKIISLSSNPITNFPRSLFAYFTSLKMLSIRRISFSEIEPNTFYDLNIEFIDTSDYHICCITLSILSVMPLNPGTYPVLTCFLIIK